jgi:site-specific DNA-methyltransferase (adenine-specific)
VLKHGVGALNIDGCRVGDFINTTSPGTDRYNQALYEQGYRPDTYKGHGAAGKAMPERTAPPGRWPANIIHDGSDEVLACFPDGGARFFYSAKADAEDRWGSKHPTVKPVALIRWLMRLVTPPGGLVLDPFAGSGTAGVAALAEGFEAILIERDPGYCADIRERLAHYLGEGRHSLVSKNRHARPTTGSLL